MSDIFAKITLLFLNSKRFVIFFYSFFAHLGCFGRGLQCFLILQNIFTNIVLACCV